MGIRITTLKMNGKSVIERCLFADTFFTRLIGLIGKKSLAENEAILFPRCRSIHTCFMRFSIDVLFVSSNGTVIRIVQNLKPFRFVFSVPSAEHIIEVAGGVTQKKHIQNGSKLEYEGLWA